MSYTYITLTAGMKGMAADSLVSKGVSRIAQSLGPGSERFHAVLRTPNAQLAAEWVAVLRSVCGAQRASRFGQLHSAIQNGEAERAAGLASDLAKLAAKMPGRASISVASPAKEPSGGSLKTLSQSDGDSEAEDGATAERNVSSPPPHVGSDSQSGDAPHAGSEAESGAEGDADVEDTDSARGTTLLSDRELRARKERQALSEQMGELVAENEALRAQLLAHESALRGSQASLLRLSEAAKNEETSAGGAGIVLTPARTESTYCDTPALTTPGSVHVSAGEEATGAVDVSVTLDPSTPPASAPSASAPSASAAPATSAESVAPSAPGRPAAGRFSPRGFNATDSPEARWGYDGDGTDFSVRIGPDYKRHGKKSPSASQVYELVAADVIKCEKILYHASECVTLPPPPDADVENNTGLPRRFVINVVVPAEAPSFASFRTDGPCYQIILYFTSSVARLREWKAGACPAARLFERWVTHADSEQVHAAIGCPFCVDLPWRPPHVVRAARPGLASLLKPVICNLAGAEGAVQAARQDGELERARAERHAREVQRQARADHQVGLVLQGGRLRRDEHEHLPLRVHH